MIKREDNYIFNFMGKVKIRISLFVFINIFIYCLATPLVGYAMMKPKDHDKKNDLSKKQFNLTITNGLLSLQAKDADLRRILEEIADTTGIEIEIHPNVGGIISLSFKDRSLEEALKKITRNRGIVFSKERDENRYQISRVVIPASSQNPTDSKTPDYHISKSPAHGSMNSESPGIKMNPPTRASTSIPLINEKRGTQSNIISNELIIRFKRDLSRKDIQALIAKSGAAVKSHIKALNYYVLSLPSRLTVNEALNWYLKQGVVDRAEPNYLIPIKTIPDDPDFSKQWALNNTGQTGGAEDADIDAAEAWVVEQGDPEVVIAIIDTGVDYTHEDLAPNLWQNPGEIPDNGIDDDGNGYIDDTIGWDFVDSFGGASGEDFLTPDNDPMDRHGHGTHAAGIAGAVSNNGLGIAGVSWNCRIMAVRAGYKTPSGGGVLESEDAAQAIIYAAENGARVINLSWGDYQQSSLIEDAMFFATGKGSLICAAAGNGNTNNRIYPAASDNAAVLAVGATDHRDRKASFSNYGEWVHVSAPGVAIYSTDLHDSYNEASGTSMAAPHVAGLAALLFSYFPDLSPIAVKNRIMRSVDRLENLMGKNITSGRINAHTVLITDYNTPHIFSLNPGEAHEGDGITLFGDRFGSEQGEGYVEFHPGLKADIISWRDSTIVCRVPDGAQTGELKVTTSEGTSNGIDITILIRYYEESRIQNGFLGAGQSKGWHADDQSWLYQLPFSFPFFGKHYGSVYVCSNGFLDFTNDSPSYLNNTEVFKKRVMIAPMWDDLNTYGSSQQKEDILIHAPSPDSVCIRWAGEHHETGVPVNAEVILYEDGRIQFNYGSRNTNLSPTIGISGGEDNNYHISSYDGNSQLDHVESVLFTPQKQSFTIYLDRGWNLISLPLNPDNNQVHQIMSSVSSGIESIWGLFHNTWQVYVPGQPGISDLETMKTGYGYWIKTDQDDLSIEIHGNIKTIPVQVTPGWNLMGICSVESMPVEKALKDIEGKYEIVWGYKDGVWQLYDPRNPGFSDLSEIEPGRGYWVR